jgi:hypothetical protein
MIVRQFPEQKVLSMTLQCTTARESSGAARRDKCVQATNRQSPLPGEREAIVAVLML